MRARRPVFRRTEITDNRASRFVIDARDINAFYRLFSSQRCQDGCRVLRSFQNVELFEWLNKFGADTFLSNAFKIRGHEKFHKNCICVTPFKFRGRGVGHMQSNAGSYSDYSTLSQEKSIGISILHL